jgi:Na+/H+ antiporter NhaD/arsenite permease-like protein
MQSKQRANIVFIAITAIIMFTLISCAAGPGSKYTPEKPAGFWVGLWHGVIALITLIISFFSDNVRIYEVNNTGVWYDVGFFLGIIIMAGGSSGGGAASRKSKNRKDGD